MKVVQINATCGIGSTGKICVAVSNLLNEKNIENYIFYSNKSNGCANGISFASKEYIKLLSAKSYLLGNWGLNSSWATQKIIAKLQEIKPDIVHLHNIHGHDCNIAMLFNYFKRVNQKIYWTFHDCWAFTGYCMHFVTANCDKWKTGCKNCPQRKEYSAIFDRSAYLYHKKNSLFKDLDLTIITPSQWLRNLVKDSFLKDYPVKVINNGINLDVFKPYRADVRSKYHISPDKKILLGVSFQWGYKKGLDVFIQLAEELPKEKFQIVLVGTNAETDKLLPSGIISIHKTENQTELAKIYSAADVFVNPTREDTFPTVNMEAVACMTPVVTFDSGGCKETIDDKTGIVVPCGDVEAMKSAIQQVCFERIFDPADFMQRATSFDMNARFKEYCELYQ